MLHPINVNINFTKYDDEKVTNNGEYLSSFN